MDLILDVFKDYGIEYDNDTKRVIVNQEMDVKTFVFLRLLLKMAKEPINDLQLYSSVAMRVRAENDRKRAK